MVDESSNYPHEALLAIAKTLETGQKKGYTQGYWRTQRSTHHIDRALKHIHKFYVNKAHGREDDEDHLAHALTRLAMAISCRAIGK